MRGEGQEVWIAASDELGGEELERRQPRGVDRAELARGVGARRSVRPLVVIVAT